MLELRRRSEPNRMGTRSIFCQRSIQVFVLYFKDIFKTKLALPCNLLKYRWIYLSQNN